MTSKLPLSAAATATICRVTVQTVQNWCRSGRLSAVRIRVPRTGKLAWRIAAQDVAALADELRQTRAREAAGQPVISAIAQTLAAGQLPRDLVEAVVFYAELQRRWRRSRDTQRLYRVYLSAYLRFLDEREIAPTFSALTPRLVGLCQDWFRERGRGRRGGVSSEKQLVCILKAFSRMLADQGVVPEDPLARLRRPRPPKVHRKPYTELELQRLIETATQGRQGVRDRALILLLLDTGCRIGEACKADLVDLDLNVGSIAFRYTKNSQPREVLFRVDGAADGGPCLAALRAWLEVRTARPGVSTLFTLPSGRPLVSDWARVLIRRLGDRAEVAGAIPHRFRHTAATQFLTQRPGAEIQLRSRLGHLTPEILSSYVEITQAMATDGATVGSVSSRLLATPAPSPSAQFDPHAWVMAAVGNDPAKRMALLQALIGAA